MKPLLLIRKVQGLPAVTLCRTFHYAIISYPVHDMLFYCGSDTGRVQTSLQKKLQVRCPVMDA